MSYRCGRVALLGKPNVGKSTLLNYMVGQKVSIVSEKPQTTRTSILGIAHRENAQILFLDTPGIHVPHTRLDRTMVQASKSTFDLADLVLVLADGSHHPGELDKEVAKSLKMNPRPLPVILCLNKMDRLKAENVEAYIEAYSELFQSEDYMLTQANRGINLDKLEAMIIDRLPEGEPEFDDDSLTDKSSRFLCAELIREQILLQTREEIPYACAVSVDSWEVEGRLTRIGATILVDRASQRTILIGKGGQTLKAIGQAARLEMEHMLESKVFLDLHIRVEENWRMKPRILHELQYDENL